MLHELDLGAALRWVAEMSRERHNLNVSLEDDGQPKPLGSQTRSLVIRAVRELLVNVTKHAGTDRAIVSARRDGDMLEVAVQDDGSGFDTAGLHGRLGPPRGFGLFSIREQLSQVSGRLWVDSSPGRGTRARLTVPLEGEHHFHEESGGDHPDPVGR